MEEKRKAASQPASRLLIFSFVRWRLPFFFQNFLVLVLCPSRPSTSSHRKKLISGTSHRSSVSRISRSLPSFSPSRFFSPFSRAASPALQVAPSRRPGWRRVKSSRAGRREGVGG